MGNNLEFSIVINTQTGEASLKHLDGTIKNTTELVKNSAKAIETNWVNAFTRLNVLSTTFSAIKSAFGGLLEGPMQFEQSLRNVGSLSEDVVANYGVIGDKLKALGRTMPVKSTKELADAMYQAVSAGFQWGDALKLVESAAKGSIAGLSSVPESMNALISVMNAYNLSGKDSAMVMDRLFQTVRKGITTFPELAASMSQVAPRAANAGIKLDELMGSIVTITKMKVPTSEAMTKISASITPLVTILGEAYFKTHTFQEGLTEIYKRASGNVAEIQKMMGTKEATDAVIMIGKNAQQSKKDLEDMKNSAGASTKAYNENVNSLANTIQLFQNQLKSFKNAAITALMPTITELVKHLTKIMGVINNIPTPIKVLISGLLLFKTATIALNLSGLQPLLASFSTLSYGLLGKLTAQFPLLAKVAMTSATSFKALSFVLSTTLVGAVLALIAYLPQLVDWFNSLGSASKLSNALKEVGEEYDKLKEKIEQTNETKELLNEYIELQDRVRRGDKLSAEEKERLAEVTKRLGDMYPELIKGSDDATNSYILQADAVEKLQGKINGTIAELDKLMQKNAEIIKKAKEEYESGPSFWDYVGSFFNPGSAQLKEIANQKGNLLIMNKSIEESFKIYLEKIKLTKNLTDPKKLVREFQIISNNIAISDEQWRKLEGRIYQVQATFRPTKTKTEAGLSGLKEELKSLYEQYKNLDKDSNEAMRIRQIVKAKLQTNTKKLGITGQEAKEFRKLFDIGISGVSKTEVKKEAEINLLDITNTLYESNKITFDQYLERTNKLYDEIINSARYKELSEKFSKGLLTPIEEKEFVSKLKEISKITEAQEKYAKEIGDKNFEAYEKMQEERKKKLETSTNELKNYLLKSRGDIDKAIGLYSNQQISGKEFINSLDDYINQIKENLSNGNKDIENILNEIQWGDLTDYELNELRKSLESINPVIANNFDSIVNIFDIYNKEMAKLQSENLTSLKFWVDQASTILQIASAGLGEVLMSGFSKEGFEKMKNMLKEGFKTILLAIADALDKMFIGISLSTILEAIINPAMGIVNTGRLLAAKLGIEAFKGMIKAFSVGGIITQPTIALMGEKGAEVVAPKQDFISFARELIAYEKRNLPKLVSGNNINVKLEPVILKQSGRDLVGVIKQQNQIDDLRKF